MVILLLLFALGLIFGGFLTAISSVLGLVPYYIEINTAFATAIGYFKGFMLAMPYLDVVYNAFLIILTVEVVFIIAKVFLGPRWWGSSNV
jgi:hypothetical protein